MSEHKIETKDDIYNTLKKILIEDFECPEKDIEPNANLFTTLDLDSIDAVDLVVKLQKITEKKINPEEFREVRTIQDVIDTIYKLFSNQ